MRFLYYIVTVIIWSWWRYSKQSWRVRQQSFKYSFEYTVSVSNWCIYSYTHGFGFYFRARILKGMHIWMQNADCLYNSIYTLFKSFMMLRMQAVVSFITMQFQLCTVYFTFSLGTRTHYFGRTILHGGAKVWSYFLFLVCSIYWWQNERVVVLYRLDINWSKLWYVCTSWVVLKNLLSNSFLKLLEFLACQIWFRWSSCSNSNIILGIKWFKRVTDTLLGLSTLLMFLSCLVCFLLNILF